MAVTGAGTTAEPWVLTTPPGKASFEAWEVLGLAEVEHNPRNNRMRAI